jgi:hypothetical protein
VIWVILLILLLLIFGLGSLLKAAFWLLLIFALIGAVAVYLGSRRLGRRI